MKKTATKAKKTTKTIATTTKNTTKKRYTESHWLIFLLEGLIALAAGAYVMFTGINEVPHLVTTTGIVLVAISIIEIFNTLHRKRLAHNWGISLAIALFEAAIGTAMLIANQESHILHIALLATYTIIRGLATLIIGFTNFRKKPTPRFLWVACGTITSIIGFTILADTGFSDTIFIKIFATFLMVFGLTNLFFGIYSRDEIKKLK